VTDHKRTHDTLRSLLTQGIIPQKDIYNGTIDGAEKSTSVTHLQNYARIYACRHLADNNTLEFENKSNSFWWYLLLLLMVIGAFQSPSEIIESIKNKTQKSSTERKQRQNSINKWSTAISKDKKTRRNPMYQITHSRSDINQNFPIIVGIKKGELTTIPLNSTSARMYESRTDQIITSSQFTHLEVPLANLQHTQELLEKLQVKEIPIIPMEYVEYLQSQKPFWKHLKPAHQAKKKTKNRTTSSST